MVDRLSKTLSAKLKSCDNGLQALPTMGLVIGNVTLHLEPNDYMDVGPKTCLFTWMDVKDTGKGPLVVLGMPFLRKYYTVFDFKEGAPRLGFARARHGAADAPVDPKAKKYVDVPLTPERKR